MSIPEMTSDGEKVLDIIDEYATARGVAMWRRLSNAPVMEGSAGPCFLAGYGLGELAMLHRVRQVLDDPRSRGREVAILRSLAFSQDDEAASKWGRR